MKILNEQKIQDKIKSMIPRALNLVFDFNDYRFSVSFSISRVIIPNNNPEHFSLKVLNNLAQEFGDDEIQILTGINNDVILKIVVGNKEYYEVP